MDEQRLIERLGLRPARWAYFQKRNGPMFVYNTERLYLRDQTNPAHGKFESSVFVQDGKDFIEVPDSRSAHTLRRDAKTRALRLFEHWLATGEIDV